MPLTLPDNLNRLAAIALRAGREIMTIYGSNVTAREKADLSPVTEADEAAERLILHELAALDPGIPIVSEEAAAAGHIPETADLFYLVDPLDGTKEFLTRNGEFTVNIGLVRDGRPICGVVYAPAKGEIFAGQVGQGAWCAKVNGEAMPEALSWTNIQTRSATPAEPVVVASRSHMDARTEAWLKAKGRHSLKSAGSSLKFCLLAKGEADYYPRFGRTMEWDTAAGHAVLAAAGGSVATETGEPLTYGKASSGYANPGFIASAGA
ncbi:MAG: 3'(2'),5'-bisphosphate nucleotidase CysQ [Rhizobiales bacterium]|nr:3'(2'),5'-bisphosphate nucleotidase CysQ [Hyphomicrobiales bacterium]